MTGIYFFRGVLIICDTGENDQDKKDESLQSLRRYPETAKMAIFWVSDTWLGVRQDSGEMNTHVTFPHVSPVIIPISWWFINPSWKIEPKKECCSRIWQFSRPICSLKIMLLVVNGLILPFFIFTLFLKNLFVYNAAI